MNLNNLGWNAHFDSAFEPFRRPGLVPARVALEHREMYVLYCPDGELTGQVSGKFRHQARWRSDFPAVGDWVVIDPRYEEGRATIQAVLDRTGTFSRKAVLSGGMPESGGETDRQVLAANIDLVFLVTGLDGNFNIRRIERYVTAAWDSGAAPVIVLNKADLCEDVDERVAEVEEVAMGVDILVTSALEQDGLDQISRLVKPGLSVVFLGSSGVGKSTIINGLLGEERLHTREVSAADSRGRHTTTHRELILLPNGGIVIDTPGMREIAIWGEEQVLERTFDDIFLLAEKCRFSDCRHETEPGCAVRTAIESGHLDADRFRAFVKMQKELQHLALRKDVKAQRQMYREWDRKVRMHHKAIKDLRKKGLA